MPMLKTKSIKYSAAGEAARREQIRNADLDREERSRALPTIFVKAYGFRAYYNDHDNIQIKGPLCPSSITKERRCLAPLTGGGTQSLTAHCDVCGKNYTMPHAFDEFRGIAHRAYEGLLNSQTELITLDVPYEAVKAKEEDDTRWIKVVWSQKDGRNQAVIYFIEKAANGDKAQIFADLDREEIRYDAGDVPPGKILAKVKAEFRETKVDIDYKKD
jgi:hypothetical protein